ncbi:hypothetical protein QB910_000042 [Dabrowskivirus KKP3916]|uniref:MurNAc-LAA domain-containing protein n=1 Tax=Alicyclobacillus phage KKP_3916 TaxID=3040651 RepID=A0AAT9V7K2_9CAUD|nr:hypothetical protein QB910_000042 [Alicyclobacillus phage KKP 3916]
MYKICIDAGHGGYDTGNILGGLQEKSLSLGVAQALNSLLTKDGNFEVVMTRSGDYSAGHYENQVARELSERARISNEYEADLFSFYPLLDRWTGF